MARSGMPPWRTHDDVPPEFAGRYELAGLIGSGGTARVYLAFDQRLRRDVAVKVYERGAAAVEQLRRAREKAIQAGIDHPGVVALLDSGTEGDRPYLVLRLVNGENLAQRLLTGPLPVEQVTELATRLTEALAHVHARRVVHRDLKPANVLLGADGPLISDFGIAHELDATHVTGTGQVTGTAAYLAPEQVVGEHAGPPADVYALGLILLECLTGEREYPGTLAESAVARLNRPPRIPDGLPAPLARTLERMTAHDPGERPTAGEVLRLLRQPVPAASGATRRRLILAGGLTTAAVLAAGLALWPDAPNPGPGQAPAAGSTLPPGPTPPTASPKPAASTVMLGRPEPAAAPPQEDLATARSTAVENGPANRKTKEKGPDRGKGHGPPAVNPAPRAQPR